MCLSLFKALGGMIGTAIFLYWSDINVLSEHEVAGDEFSVSPILLNRSRVVLMLNFCLASLPLLLKMGMINILNLDVLSM